MTEIEQLKADLATLENAKEVAATLDGGFSDFRFRTLIDSLKQKIADLEAQQAPPDEWADSRMFVQEILADSSFPQRLIWLARYARHLESKVAELDHELRCERIDGGKVRDDRKAISAEKSREKLAELTTILNAIPPVCRIFFYSEQSRETLELARELVERRIEGIKREMQNNG